MKLKHMSLGAGLVLATSLFLLVGCSGNKKTDKSKESSSSQPAMSKSSDKSSSKMDVNTSDKPSQNSETSSSKNAQANSDGSSSDTAQEIATLAATTQGRIAMGLAKMASLTPDIVSTDRIKSEPQLIFKSQNSSFGYTEYFIANGMLDNPSEDKIGGYAYCLILKSDGFVQYATQALPSEDPATTNPTYAYNTLTTDEINLATVLKDKIVIN